MVMMFIAEELIPVILVLLEMAVSTALVNNMIQHAYDRS